MVQVSSLSNKSIFFLRDVCLEGYCAVQGHCTNPFKKYHQILIITYLVSADMSYEILPDPSTLGMKFGILGIDS